MPRAMIKVPKDEYEALLRIKRQFNEIGTRYFEASATIQSDDFFQEPPTRSAKKLLSDLKASKKHSAATIRSIAKGLKESKFFTP